MTATSGLIHYFFGSAGIRPLPGPFLPPGPGGFCFACAALDWPGAVGLELELEHPATVPSPNARQTTRSSVLMAWSSGLG